VGDAAETPGSTRLRSVGLLLNDVLLSPVGGDDSILLNVLNL
jgi:hypothetical protein